MSYGIICQSCGLEAPSKKVEFHQNIGALVMRFHRSAKGNLCKKCVNEKFWSMTMITLLVGWLGLISIVIAPIFIIMNIVNYLTSLTMPAVPADAKVPVIGDREFGLLDPLRGEIISRLNVKEPVNDVARSIATKAAVTPGQVLKYIVAISTAPMAAIPQAKGFPVVMPGAAPVAGSGNAGAGQ